MQINNGSFICPKRIELEKFERGSIDAIYEPRDIENITAILTASSKTAGIFT